MANNLREYRQAAFSYLGIGVIIVILTTVFIPESHYRSGYLPLIIGIVVLLAVAHYINKGVRWLAIIICVLAAVRSGWWFYSFTAFADEGPRWVYMINAVLNLIIVFMLARAAAEKKEPDADR